jgi:hypothetical protein
MVVSTPAHVFRGFLIIALTRSSFQATYNFCHMHQWWELRNCLKKNLPGNELATARSYVRYAHHWSSRPGLLRLYGHILENSSFYVLQKKETPLLYWILSRYNSTISLILSRTKNALDFSDWELLQITNTLCMESWMCEVSLAALWQKKKMNFPLLPQCCSHVLMLIIPI